MAFIKDSVNLDLLKVGSCIEFDLYFDILLKDLNNIEELFSNYKNIFDSFPFNLFDIKIEAIHSDICFLEELFFEFADTKENYCNYLYKYND